MFPNTLVVLAVVLGSVRGSGECDAVGPSLRKSVPSLDVLSTIPRGHDPQYQVIVDIIILRRYIYSGVYIINIFFGDSECSDDSSLVAAAAGSRTAIAAPRAVVTGITCITCVVDIPSPLCHHLFLSFLYTFNPSRLALPFLALRAADAGSQVQGEPGMAGVRWDASGRRALREHHRPAQDSMEILQRQ